MPHAWRGFTLVELLFALAIIGILAAIGSISHTRYSERAKVRRAIGDIRAIEGAIDTFRAEFGAYPDSLARVGQAGRLDPWGRAYQFLNLTDGKSSTKGKARKDKSLVPINSTYDLYSMGADGLSQAPLTSKQSRDDVVRANDGAYVGLGADY